MLRDPLGLPTAWSIPFGIATLGAALALLLIAGSLAERLYLRNGFVRTGTSGCVRPGDPRVEYEMMRKL